MWQVHGNKVALRVGTLFVTGCLFLHPANAQSAGGESFNLPGVSLPQGTDEVRAADGTSCRSAVGGSGAYVDMGLIGKKGASNDGSYYGRVVVPLGGGSKRLDCSRLYDLEVERLKLELELAKAGMGQQVDPSLDETETSSLQEEAPKKAKPAAIEAEAGEEVFSETAVVESVPKKKKKAGVDAVAIEQEAAIEAAPEKVAKVQKLKKTKVGKADWANDGWSTAGLEAD